PDRERITEVGLVSVDLEGDDTRVTEWSSLVNPGVPIPPEIQWLTGITNDMVRGAPPFADVAQDIYDRLDGALFVAPPPPPGGAGPRRPTPGRRAPPSPRPARLSITGSCEGNWGVRDSISMHA